MRVIIENSHKKERILIRSFLWDYFAKLVFFQDQA